MKETSKREIRFPILFSTRIDWETKQKIDKIALFDRKKPGSWLRDLIVDAVKRYERNPQYLRFKRDLEARDKKKEV